MPMLMTAWSKSLMSWYFTSKFIIKSLLMSNSAPPPKLRPNLFVLTS